jgi:hypothetical protein
MNRAMYADSALYEQITSYYIIIYSLYFGVTSMFNQYKLIILHENGQDYLKGYLIIFFGFYILFSACFIWFFFEIF